MTIFDRRVAFLWTAFLCLILFLLLGCQAKIVQRKLVAPEHLDTVDKRSAYLKAHMFDGQVYILSKWQIDSDKQKILAEGTRQDINREVVDTGSFHIDIDSVAIFETNVITTSPSVAALSIISAGSAALTIYCATHPKACFGSCPTFYVSDGDNLSLQAEGFSSSVAPFLEARDIDALYHAKSENNQLKMVMKNEALETHVIRYIHLLTVPKLAQGRVFATSDGTFWQVSQIRPPTRAHDVNGDCLAALRAFDHNERYSTTDSTNLAEKELIDLDFSIIPDGEVGLVISCRQTLLTTYLFYQTLAYMGESVGGWMAILQRQHKSRSSHFAKINRALGGIEVLVQNETGGWTPVGEITEVGPLATDVHLLPLPEFKHSTGKIRLRMTRGLWRLDYVALAELHQPVQPIRVFAAEVLQNEIPDQQATELLRERKDALITLPGDEYTLIFDLPEKNQKYEFFLETRGYYLEWMRQEWLTEENFFKAALMFSQPEVVYRMLAPEYKKLEGEMEDLFWRSRYAK